MLDLDWLICWRQSLAFLYVLEGILYLKEFENRKTSSYDGTNYVNIDKWLYEQLSSAYRWIEGSQLLEYIPLECSVGILHEKVFAKMRKKCVFDSVCHVHFRNLFLLSGLAKLEYPSISLPYIVLFPFFWVSSPSGSTSPEDCLRFLVYFLVGVSCSSRL